jgi:hypothetical protein
MRARELVLGFGLLAFSVAAGAQVGFCSGPAIPGTISIQPGSPTTSQSVTITVVASDFAPQSIGAQVQGQAINVTLAGQFFGFQPPPACGTTTIGPLASGQYVVNYYLVVGSNGPVLQSSQALVVIPDPIPATTTLGIALLAAAVATLGVWASRRRTARRA